MKLSAILSAVFPAVFRRRVEDGGKRPGASETAATEAPVAAEAVAASEAPAAEAVAALEASAALEEGRRLLLLGRLGEAEGELERALGVRPGYVLAWKLLAWVAAERGDWPRAAAQWRRVLETPLEAAELTEARQSLAIALGFTGEFAEANGLADALDTDGQGQTAAELRMMLTQKALDDKGHVEARRDYGRRFPEAAADSTGWLRFAGGEDSPEAPRYTDGDLHLAGDAAAARRILSYLELRMPHTEFLQLAAHAVAEHSDPLLGFDFGADSGSGVDSDAKTAAAPSPEQLQAAANLQMEYIQHLLHYLSSNRELTEVQARTRAFCERFPDNSRGRLLLSHAAVAANDFGTVEKLIEAAGGGDLELWLAAAKGDHRTAAAVWQRIRRSRYLSAADGRGLDLTLRSREPRHPFREKILLFAAFRNERLFAPWFLDYYRALGVEHFFIVDNRSDDGTDDYLAAQKNVTLFSSGDNYNRAHSGMRWINELIRRYGDDNWCVHVDSDEQLVVPEQESGGPAPPLRRLVDGMAARGEEALPAFMLDTSPPVSAPQDLAALESFRAGDDPLKVSPLIDPDIFFFGKQDCCFFRVRGGVRDRLFDFHSTMEKAPVLRGGGGRFYLSAHNCSYARPAARSAVLLHHKLMRELMDIAKPDAAAQRVDDRGTYCRIRHGRYRDAAFLNRLWGGDESGGKENDSPLGPDVVAYKDSAQLQRLGLLGDFNPFQPPSRAR